MIVTCILVIVVFNDEQMEETFSTKKKGLEIVLHDL